MFWVRSPTKAKEERKLPKNAPEGSHEIYMREDVL
jgi:hypothetical protein